MAYDDYSSNEIATIDPAIILEFYFCAKVATKAAIWGQGPKANFGGLMACHKAAAFVNINFDETRTEENGI